MKPIADRYRIVQHVAGFDQIGGPAIQLRRLLRSRIAERYDLKVVSQNRVAGGINVSLIREMAASIRSFRPHLVHVRGLQNEGFHGVLAAYVAGCYNVLVSVHGFAQDALGNRPFNKWVLSRLSEPLTLMLARHVYCVSSVSAERPVIRRFAARKCSVLHNGIEISPPLPRDEALRARLGAQPDDVVALYVGRIVRDKGLFVLADALHTMQTPPVIWLAGDGPDLEALRVALGALADSGRVRLLGRRDDIPALLAACDFFVFPTLHENLSNALLEAMQAERAVITTAVGGNPELVENGTTGLLIPASDSLALANSLAALQSQAELRSRMGCQGRKRVEEHFSMTQTVERLTILYERMLDGHRSDH